MFFCGWAFSALMRYLIFTLYSSLVLKKNSIALFNRRGNIAFLKIFEYLFMTYPNLNHPL